MFQFPRLKTCQVIKPHSSLMLHVCYSFGLFRAQHTIAFKTSSDRHNPSLYVSLVIVCNYKEQQKQQEENVARRQKLSNIEDG